MSLRTKSIIIICITFAGLLAILLGASSIIVRGGFERVEQADIRQAVEALVSTLNQEIDNLTRTNIDYASWDDTYQFIQDGNSTYKDANLLDATFSNLRINFIVYVHASGRIIYGRGFDLESQTQKPLPGHFLEHVDRYGPVYEKNAKTRRVNGIVLFPEGPALISSCPIIRSNYDGPVRGALIMGRYLDDREVRRFSEAVRLPVDCFPFRDGKMPSEIEEAFAGSACGEKIAVRPVDARTIAGYSVINDIYGNQALAVRIEKPRRIYIQGLATLRYYILFLCLTGLLFAAVLLLLLEKSILSRLARIENRVKEIRSTRNFTERISESGRDELANLSTGINSMLESVESAQKLLAASEARYRQHFTQTLDVLFTIDLGFRILMVSPNIETLLGYRPEEIAGKTVEEVKYLFTVESFERASSDMTRVLSGESLAGMIYEMVAKDGTRKYCEVSGALLIQDGQNVGITSIARDITDRKKAEEALKASEERYRSILRNIEEGYFEVDIAGRFTYFNDSMRNMLGYSSDELMGMSNRHYMKEETAKRVFKTFNAVYRTGTPSRAFDWELVRKDGQTIFVSTSVSLVKDSGNHPVGFRGIARDITQEKLSEEKLRESEKKYRDLVENMKDVFYTADETGKITYVSPVIETVVGFTPEEVMRKRITDFLHPDDVPLIAADYKKMLRGISAPNRYRIITKDGAMLWVRTFIQPVHDERDRRHIIGVQGIISDITDQKIAEEDLQAHRDHLELINKILRHDLTNDLATIRSAVSLYRDSGEEELLDEASRRIEKSVELIRRMRELESFMSSRRNLKLIDMEEIVTRVSANYPVLEVSRQGAFHAVLADEAIESVIDNILRNALIHGKARKVSVSAERNGDAFILRIADDGIGIPGTVKEQVFEEGFTYGATGQSGLGLHIVKKAMESYGGSVYADDNSPRGAVFVLQFRMVG